MTDAKPSSAPADLRQTTRVAVSWRARVSPDGVSFVDCRTFDISLGGIGLLCGTPLAHGVEMRVALQLPATAGGEGRVVTSKARPMFQILSGADYRIGMQWSVPDDPALAVLGAWSRRRAEPIKPPGAPGKPKAPG